MPDGEMDLAHHVANLVRALSLTQRPYTAAVILAGGVGSRMKTENGQTKQWLMLDGKPVLFHAIQAFERCPEVDEIVLVCRGEEIEKTALLVKESAFRKVKKIVAGGKTRQHSAYNGARRVSEETKFIAVHDAARCLLTPEEISAVVSAAYADRAASLGVRVRDTVKRADKSGYVSATVEREGLWLAATPQVFSYPMYIAAATSALKNGYEVTDDNMLMEYIGQRVRMVEASSDTMKLTVPDDILRAEAILAARKKKTEKQEI